MKAQIFISYNNTGAAVAHEVEQVIYDWSVACLYPGSPSCMSSDLEQDAEPHIVLCFGFSLSHVSCSDFSMPSCVL